MEHRWGRVHDVGRVRIADLEVDLEREVVSRAGVTVALPPLSFRLLAALIRAHPGVAGPQDLLRELWPQGYVTEQNLKQRVYLLRRALGDDADAPRYVEAVRGWGYQLASPPTPLPGRHLPLVAVADVTGPPATAALARALTAALRRELERRGQVAVAPHGRLLDALRLLREEVSGPVEAATALRAAARDGAVELVLAGSLWPLAGGGIALEAVLLAVGDGTPVERVRVDAPTPGDLLGRVSEVVDGLGAVWPSVDEFEAATDGSPPSVTTRSIDALRWYAAALDAFDVMATGRARELLEEAVAADPEFGSAWVDLTWARIWNEDPEGARDAAERARSLADQLTEGERHHALALAASLAGALDQAIDHYEVATALEPSHYWATVNLAGCQLLAGRGDAAATTYRRALELRPHAPVSHWDLGIAELTARGDLDAAAAHLRVVRELAPAFPFPLPWLVEALEAWVRLDLDEAQVRFADALARRLPAAPPIGQHMGMLLHARLLATAGRWDQAVAELERAASVVDEDGAWWRYTQLELALTGVEAEQRAVARTRLERLRSSGSALYRAQATGWLAVLAARDGDDPEPLLGELAALDHDGGWAFGYPTRPAFTRAQRCFPALARAERSRVAGGADAVGGYREALAAAPRHVDGPVPVVALGPAVHVAAMEGAARAAAAQDRELAATGYRWLVEHPVTTLVLTPAGAGPWGRARTALADRVS